MVSMQRQQDPLGQIFEGWIIVILLFQSVWGESILQVPNSQVSTDSCQGLPDGIHPDFEQACRLFFACSDGRRLATFWCVRGYVYSSSTGKCEPPDRAICRPPLAKSSLEDCPLGDGFFPDYETGCSQFDFCKDGKKTKLSCPTSTVFDWRTESCQPSSKVSCQPMHCDGKEDGTYPDRDNQCRRYVNCTSGNATTHSCPYGQFFNSRSKNCSERSSTCHPSVKSRCLGLPDGYYPDHNRSCRTFEMCISGQSKVYNCPANTSFNLDTLTCDDKSQCQRPERNKCRGKPNGIYPESTTDCRHFYACIDGLLVKSGSCPLGKSLNMETFTCESVSTGSCSSAISGQCSSPKDGLHPDYGTGCSGYFLCRNGRKIVQNYCVGENLFDVATFSCLPASYVSCSRSSGHSFAPRLLHSYDCSGRVGLFPEYSNQCKQFIVCAYGQQTLFECPNGTYFDSETSSCQKEKVSCVPPSVISIFQCLPSDEGIYPGSSCDHWNECRRGVGFTIACPPGQTFNVAYSKCLDNHQDKECSSKIRKPVSGVAQFNVFEDENLIFDCYDKPNGVYQSQNCRVFHICAEGSLSSFYCPSAMTFDFESQQCQPLKQNSTCDVESAVSSKVRSNECDGVDDGMYADYDLDCRRYFVCEGGRAILVYCPERQKFSSVKMICDHEDKVSCLPPSGVTINATEIDFEGLIYHVEVAREEDTTADLPINTNYRNRYMRNGTVEPNSISAKTTTNKRNHNLKDSTSPPFNDDGNYSYISSNRSSVIISQTPCPDGDTGFFPDYNSDCKQFHICFRSIRKTYSCPSVLKFNPETKNCDLPENVVCSPPISANSAEFDCKILENQFVPDFSSGCKQFVGCSNNVPYRFFCPAGKLFNPSSRTCETADSVNCIPASVREDPSKEPTFRHSHGFRRNSFDCSKKLDGFYADFNRHCHVFYRCVRGKKFSHYCKQGLLFNPESGICDFEENVVCSNSTVPNQR